MAENLASDTDETQKIVMAIHGGGIEPGTSEIALAAAGYHPATLAAAADGHALHDFWLFEGLLPAGAGNDRLHVTAIHYDEPIATDPSLEGRDRNNIANKTKIGGGAQLEMERRFRRGLFGTDSRDRRKHTTPDFWHFITALRRAMSRVG